MKYIFILFLMCLSPAVMAQDNSPIEVTADNALEWDRANSIFRADGNAIITQGDSMISAPNVTAYYKDTDNGIEIQKVTAKTNATLKQPGQTLTAKTVDAVFKDGVLSEIIATNNVVLKTKTETLYGDKANYDAINRKVVVTGNVKIEQDNNVLTGNRAEFDLKTNISTLTSSPQSGGRVKAVFYNKGNE